MDEHQKKFVKLHAELSHRHSNILSNFAEMGALTIANCLSLRSSKQWKQREKRYTEIVRQYQPEETESLSSMLGCLVLSLEDRLHDAIGEIYMTDELCGRSKWDSDVCFTPWELARAMAKMTLANFQMPERGWFTMSEPAAGCGALVIAAAAILKEMEVNFQQTMHVTAVEIRPMLAHLCYIQLSLLGIPAIVIHGNTLSQETWSVWHTPMHVMGFWDLKLARWQKENPTVQPMKKGQMELF